MSLFSVKPHPGESQLLAGSGQTRADFVYDVMPDQAAHSQMGHARTFWSLVLDSSGSMAGRKMDQLKAAVSKILSAVPDAENFELQVVYFHTFARELIPPSTGREIHQNRRAMARQVEGMEAKGTTSMGRGLELARDAMKKRPDAIRRVLLLSDGEQQGDEPISRVYEVAREIDRIGGQIEAWGVGSEWNEEELREIAHLSGGTADLIPSPSELTRDIGLLLDDVIATPAQDVSLIFQTPKMYELLEVKQVYPNIAPAAATRISPQSFMIPLGTVTGQGAKILVRVQGVERPAGLAVRAIKPELQYTRDGETINEPLPTESNAFVRWVTDPTEIAPRDPVVARYRGEEEIVRLQQEGFKALEAGDINLATARLAAALQQAEASGSLATAPLKALFDARTGQLRATAGSTELKTAKLLSGQTGRLVADTGRLE